MSLDVYLTPKPCPCCKRDFEPVFSRNITHNLNRMADAAGIYEVLWRPEEGGIKTAAQLVKPLTAGLETLKLHPDFFRKLNPENGWGEYEDLVEFATEYLEACKQNPECEVYVSR